VSNTKVRESYIWKERQSKRHIYVEKMPLKHTHKNRFERTERETERKRKRKRERESERE